MRIMIIIKIITIFMMMLKVMMIIKQIQQMLWGC